MSAAIDLRRVLTAMMMTAALALGVAIAAPEPAQAAPLSTTVSFAGSSQIGQGWRDPNKMTVAGDPQRVGYPALYKVDTSGRLWFYGRTATGGFTAATLAGTGFGTATRLLGGVDYNLDGIPDLLVTFGDGRLIYYQGRGDGAFSSQRQLGTGWSSMTHVAVLQYSVGGKPGIAAVSSRGVLHIYPTNGALGFGKTVVLGPGWNSLPRMTSGSDWDRNGFSDLVAVDSRGALLLYSAKPGGTTFAVTQIGQGWSTMAYFGVAEMRAQGALWSRVIATTQDGKLLQYNARHVNPSGLPVLRGVLLVNKSYSVPASYGSGLTSSTNTAFNSMRTAAAGSGLSLFVASGYRSYANQSSLYSAYVARHGQAAADRFSARPGYSEHQTGLALDVNTTSGSFGSTAAGRWVAANAWQYGFIVRYTAGDEAITGYIYEPWHLRYVGPELAGYLHRTGLTLEEYLNVWSAY